MNERRFRPHALLTRVLVVALALVALAPAAHADPGAAGQAADRAAETPAAGTPAAEVLEALADADGPQGLAPDGPVVREDMPARHEPAPDATPLQPGEVLPVPGRDGAEDTFGVTAQPGAVVFVHGLDKKAGISGGSQSHDCADYWGALLGAFPQWGYGGIMHTVGYYDGNVNCTHQLQSYGSGWSHHGNGTNNLSSDTSIRHLGYRLAWYIWNEHTSQGRSVALVGHSMGGLVSRYAVGMTASGHPDFPPYLSVQNLVTVGSPHTGSGLAWFCFSTQCSELRPGSATLSAINSADSGASGVWNRIAVASYWDEAVSESSATALPAAAWVTYDWPWFTHSGLINDTSTTWNAEYRYADSSGSGTVYPGPRPGSMIFSWASAG